MYLSSLLLHFGKSMSAVHQRSYVEPEQSFYPKMATILLCMLWTMALDSWILSTLIVHSRTCFSFPIHFHEFAKGLYPITTWVQCDQHSIVNYPSKCMLLLHALWLIYIEEVLHRLDYLSDTFMQLVEMK